MRKLSYQLMLAMTVLSVAGMLAIGVLVFSVSSRVLMRTIEQATYDRLNLNAQLIDSWKETAFGRAREFARKIEQQASFMASGDLSSYVGTFYTDITGSKEVAGVVLVSRDGKGARLTADGKFEQITAGSEPVYQAALEGKEAAGQVLRSPAGDALVVELAVPVTVNNQVVGAVGVWVPAAPLMERVRALRLGQTGSGMLVDRSGLVLAHRDANAVLAHNVITQASNPREKALFERLLAQDKPAVAYEKLGRTVQLVAAQPIPGTDWRLLLMAPQAELTRELGSLRASVLVVAAVMVAVTLLVAYLVGQIQARGIIDVTQAMERFAAGDLTTQVPVRGRTEVARLARAYNSAAARLREVVGSVRSGAQQVTEASQELADLSRQVDAAVRQVAETAHQMAQGADRQSAAATQTADNARQVGQTAQRVSQASQRAAEAAQQAASLAQQGRSAVEAITEQMERIQQAVDQSQQAVHGLGERSQRIGQIVDLITGIAEQTNLLALNAAIEAARAGEQGRGFAVVAEEVRKLAEQSRQAAQEIAALVAQIREDVERAVQSAGSGRSAVASGVSAIATSGQTFQAIAEAVERVVRLMDELSEAARQMASISEAAMRSVEEVASITEEHAAGAEEVASSTGEQATAVQRITDSAGRLAAMAEQLLQSVGVFRV
ncbi:MAG TPA: methyl-accepting chemotaxis protein [Limnochordales bacterium]